MARSSNLININGTLGNLSFYNVRGQEGSIVRTKGGPTKKQIKEGKQFELTRFNNQEFGGRATASKYIMSAVFMHKVVADYNFAGPINAMLKHIQQLDLESKRGKRNIYLTRNPKLLEGFEFNRTNSFSSIMRNRLHFTLDKDTLTATIDIPELLPGVNFNPSQQHPLFSLVANLSLVPDVVWKDNMNRYEHINDGFPEWRSVFLQTEWYPVASGAPATQLTLKSETTTIPEPPFIVMLSISVQYGTPVATDRVELTKYVGGGQILAVDSVE